VHHEEPCEITGLCFYGVVMKEIHWVISKFSVNAMSCETIASLTGSADVTARMLPHRRSGGSEP